MLKKYMIHGFSIVFVLIIFFQKANQQCIAGWFGNPDMIILTAFSKEYLENKDKYSPAMAIDGKIETCWAQKGDSKERKLFIDGSGFWAIENVIKIGIFPGVGVTSGNYGNLHKANNRLKKIKVVVNYLQEPVEKIVTFEDKPEMQYFDSPAKKFFGMYIEILDIYKGEKFNDTCIAEVDIVSKNKLLSKTNYYENILNSFTVFDYEGSFTFKKDTFDGHLPFGDPGDAKIFGTWKLKGNEIDLNYKVARYYKAEIGNLGEPDYSGPFKAKVLIRGVLDNGKVIGVSNDIKVGK